MLNLNLNCGSLLFVALAPARPSPRGYEPQLPPPYLASLPTATDIPHALLLSAVRKLLDLTPRNPSSQSLKVPLPLSPLADDTPDGHSHGCQVVGHQVQAERSDERDGQDRQWVGGGGDEVDEAGEHGTGLWRQGGRMAIGRDGGRR